VNKKKETVQTNSTKQGDYVGRKQESLREHRRISGAEL
jgi:hypothetical protein